MEVYPGLVEYYANQVNINACGVGKKTRCCFEWRKRLAELCGLCANFWWPKKGLKYFQLENLSLSTYYPKKFLTRRALDCIITWRCSPRKNSTINHWLTWSHVWNDLPFDLNLLAIQTRNDLIR